MRLESQGVGFQSFLPSFGGRKSLTKLNHKAFKDQPQKQSLQEDGAPSLYCYLIFPLRSFHLFLSATSTLVSTKDTGCNLKLKNQMIQNRIQETLNRPSFYRAVLFSYLSRYSSLFLGSMRVSRGRTPSHLNETGFTVG